MGIVIPVIIAVFYVAIYSSEKEEVPLMSADQTRAIQALKMTAAKLQNTSGSILEENDYNLIMDAIAHVAADKPGEYPELVDEFAVHYNNLSTGLQHSLYRLFFDINKRSGRFNVENEQGGMQASYIPTVYYLNSGKTIDLLDGPKFAVPKILEMKEKFYTDKISFTGFVEYIAQTNNQNELAFFQETYGLSVDEIQDEFDSTGASGVVLDENQLKEAVQSNANTYWFVQESYFSGFVDKRALLFWDVLETDDKSNLIVMFTNEALVTWYDGRPRLSLCYFGATVDKRWEWRGLPLYGFECD